ncbi:MAG: RluA family pseudouridine synthase [Bradymonadia bacterium]
MTTPTPPIPGWRLEVDPGSDGMRLDMFLVQRIPRLSRARASRLTVTVVNRPELGALKKAYRVREGWILWAERPLPDADVVPPVPEVIFSDDHLLILGKPPGLATHPTASRFKATVTWWLAQHWPEADPTHRLDVETSGVLVVARTDIANRALQNAFASGGVRKRYLAVVEGVPDQDHFVIDRPLGFVQDHPTLHSEIRLKMGPGDKPARTECRVLQRGARRALVEARPIHGRQHQIRVHLSLEGYPIVGDKLYGPDEQLFLAHLNRPLTEDEYARLGHSRHALHAASAAFDWPRGRPRQFESPLPGDLEALLRT